MGPVVLSLVLGLLWKGGSGIGGVTYGFVACTIHLVLLNALLLYSKILNKFDDLIELL